MSLKAVEALGHKLEYSQQIGENRLLVRVADVDAQPLMRKVLEGGARVTQLSAAKFSLEDLFLKALAEAGTTNVGSEIL
jgi:ABC-2 type transport system ATP-binding protein